MTAPALSPAELDEVRRFGAHDEEIVEQMEERADDEVECCWRQAPHPATLRIVCRTCRYPRLYCLTHLMLMSDMIIRAGGVTCNPCGTWARTLSELLVEVPL